MKTWTKYLIALGIISLEGVLRAMERQQP